MRFRGISPPSFAHEGIRYINEDEAKWVREIYRWFIEEGLTVDYFKRFDFCLLGDIHKIQYLGGRDSTLTINESDIGKYPGAEVIE